MFNVKKADYIFWTFIYLVVLLQLSTSEELNLPVALTYSVAIIFTIRLHVTILWNHLVEQYLNSNKTLQFFLYTFFICLITAFILTTEGYFIITVLLSEYGSAKLLQELPSIYFGMLMFSVLISGISYSVALFKQHTESETKIQELKNNVLEIEIDQLRNQLSPHFTFNILNNLQFLILKDKQEALQLLARYSKILRYYVYKSQSKLIKLDDEIEFLKDYFQLEKDRSEESLKIICLWEIPANNLLVIPFLLSTFIENAFKHVSESHTNGYFIHLNISVHEENQLHLFIENSFDHGLQELKVEGVGLGYAKKRLELSYKDRYRLDINQEAEKYSVQLHLTLSEA